MSLNCILKGADVFSMAISVAPVTSWRYYDSVYTERVNVCRRRIPTVTTSLRPFIMPTG